MSQDIFARITAPLEEELRLERDGTVSYEDQCSKLSELQQLHGLAHNHTRTTLRLIQTLWERIDDDQNIISSQLRKITARDHDDALRETLYFHVAYGRHVGPQSHVGVPVAYRYGETLEPQGLFTADDAALVSQQLFDLEVLRDIGDLPDLNNDLGKITKRFRPSDLGGSALKQHDN